jgi:hypothetical protein
VRSGRAGRSCGQNGGLPAQPAGAGTGCWAAGWGGVGRSSGVAACAAEARSHAVSRGFWKSGRGGSPECAGGAPGSGGELGVIVTIGARGTVGSGCRVGRSAVWLITQGAVRWRSVAGWAGGTRTCWTAGEVAVKAAGGGWMTEAPGGETVGVAGIGSGMARRGGVVRAPCGSGGISVIVVDGAGRGETSPAGMRTLARNVPSGLRGVSCGRRSV